jgi:6-phosphogluconolactonase/glucosamine-6-phosphate isomerase/deaminase
MTLTFSALAQARLSLFTVIGQNKADMFAKIVAGEHFPAGSVASHEVLWLVDAPAAALDG